MYGSTISTDFRTDRPCHQYYCTAENAIASGRAWCPSQENVLDARKMRIMNHGEKITLSISDVNFLLGYIVPGTLESAVDGNFIIVTGTSYMPAVYTTNVSHDMAPDLDVTVTPCSKKNYVHTSTDFNVSRWRKRH